MPPAKINFSAAYILFPSATAEVLRACHRPTTTTSLQPLYTQQVLNFRLYRPCTTICNTQLKLSSRSRAVVHQRLHWNSFLRFFLVSSGPSEFSAPPSSSGLRIYSAYLLVVRALRLFVKGIFFWASFSPLEVTEGYLIPRLSLPELFILSQLSAVQWW